MHWSLWLITGQALLTLGTMRAVDARAVLGFTCATLCFVQAFRPRGMSS